MKILVSYTDNFSEEKKGYYNQRGYVELSRELGPDENPDDVARIMFETARAAVEREKRDQKAPSQSAPKAPQNEPPPNVSEPPPNTSEPPQEHHQEWDGNTQKTGFLERVYTEEKKGDYGPYTKYGCKIDGVWFNTFDKILGGMAQSLEGKQVIFTIGKKGKYENLMGISPA